MTILDDLTTHLTRLALNELALLKQEGEPDETITAIVLQNNDARIEGVVVGLKASSRTLSAAAALTPAVNESGGPGAWPGSSRIDASRDLAETRRYAATGGAWQRRGTTRPGHLPGPSSGPLARPSGAPALPHAGAPLHARGAVVCARCERRLALIFRSSPPH